MRAFYVAYQADQPILAQAAREIAPVDNSTTSPAAESDLAQLARELPPEPMTLIPWFDNVVIVEKVKNGSGVRLRYNGYTTFEALWAGAQESV